MSTTNSHPGLSYNVGNIRRAFPPPHPHNPPNKPSPSLPQHASPYQSQAYQPQPAPSSQYSVYPYTPPAVNSQQTVQNAARQPSQVPPTLPGPRQRGPPSRQMQPAPSYLQQAMNHQPMAQQPMTSQSINNQPMNPQQLSQQSLSHQSLSQPSLSQQPLSQQTLGQPSLSSQSLTPQSISQQIQQQQQQQQQQPLSQPPLSQPPMAQSMTQSLSHQSLAQPVQSVQSVQPTQQNGNPIISHSQQSTPQPPPHPALPTSLPQIAQVQVPQVQKVQQVQPVQQQPTPPQPESAEPVQGNQDEEMEMGSQEEGEGDTSMEPKLIEGTPFVPRQPMGPMMSAPPEGGSFPTLEAVHKHVLTYCTSVGYAIVIGRSKKTVPGLKKVLFVCDRAGKPPKRVSPELRKRKTTSRKCDCQFGFFAIEQRTQWTVRYRPDPAHLQHNHGPSESPLLHPAARKLDSKMVEDIKNLKESGVGVTQTLEILQQHNPHVPLLPRDIYNARAAINRHPEKVATGLAENRPTIYSKPHPSAEERIRADLRRELAKTKEDYEKMAEENRKEIEELKNKLREKDKIIEKFEQFIDICNQRVMVSLSSKDDASRAAGAATS
ncbi:uncharacterized protein PODANS_1_23120 [Podospora anserina S mat+]|uniref:Podospora anserina S mat+ genomic DNA chromosome 1, supercontig 6 n=1 Tax=Podospora anserina (strain S / ATCC MYA-4624 / DSM 980 / FGSC 10383) TaxID=515849 RepID=B2ASD1_PODAN|nr:uncharacterized protein PODANS_1_23120 [Podospora anserina S mat+]CAP67304.1 unnamed protein product [Podospora anserina S mat+]CDP24715.1 Putative protein of unknown function [Podospora anserina S mat+]